MKIAVTGGTGLIGSQVVTILKASGHEAVSANNAGSHSGPPHRQRSR
jgi:uncharacterized protein YbjT (DUF2867 family)